MSASMAAERPPTRNPARGRINLGAEGDTPAKVVRFSREDAPNVLRGTRASPDKDGYVQPGILFNTPQRELAEMRRHRFLEDGSAQEFTGSPTAQNVLTFTDDGDAPAARGDAADDGAGALHSRSLNYVVEGADEDEDGGGAREYPDYDDGDDDDDDYDDHDDYDDEGGVVPEKTALGRWLLRFALEF